MYHIISDTHIDLLKNVNKLNDLTAKYLKNNVNVNNIILKNKILILAGDIGNPLIESYWNFLEDCASKYKHVIFITGNHEYYCKNLDIKYTIDEIDELIELRSSTIDNLHFLQKKSIILDDIQYIGCTLWTKISKNDEIMISKSMNDYRQIYKSKNKLISADETSIIHDNHVKWLKNILKNELPTIVITHHLPSLQLIDKKYRKYSDINHAFYTNLENIFNSNIKLWVAGHTHMSKKVTINKVPIIVNPLGYIGENNNTIIEEFNL